MSVYRLPALARIGASDFTRPGEKEWNKQPAVTSAWASSENLGRGEAARWSEDDLPLNGILIKTEIEFGTSLAV